MAGSPFIDGWFSRFRANHLFVRYCHPERSEGSRSFGCQMLRCAQHDNIDAGRENST
jgi:hypothetical protein